MPADDQNQASAWQTQPITGQHSDWDVSDLLGWLAAAMLSGASHRQDWLPVIAMRPAALFGAYGPSGINCVWQRTRCRPAANSYPATLLVDARSSRGFAAVRSVSRAVLNHETYAGLSKAPTVTTASPSQTAVTGAPAAQYHESLFAMISTNGCTRTHILA